MRIINWRYLSCFRPPHTPTQISGTLRVHQRQISTYGYEQAKALVFRNYGQPEQVLSLHSHSIPPAYGNLVTIRFLASPVNPADINQIQGVYPSSPTFTTSLCTPEPVAVGGNEGVAEVISIGAEVKSLQKGDWVIMKKPGFGTWRTYAQTTADDLLRINDRSGITAIQAGTVSINPCTAYRMLVDFHSLKQGDWFIQNGANSAVGRAAIQFGKLWGYKSINVIRSRATGLTELRSELTSLGADVVVTDEEIQTSAFKEHIKDWTSNGSQPILLGLNCVGGRSATALAKLLSTNGQLVTYGAMSKIPVQLPTSLLIFKNIAFKGFWVSKWGEENNEEKLKTVERILQLTRAGKFRESPVEEVTWTDQINEGNLLRAIGNTLAGFKDKKSVITFPATSKNA